MHAYYFSLLFSIFAYGLQSIEYIFNKKAPPNGEANVAWC